MKHAACHWLVNFNLALAMLVEPKRQWRILSHPRHSTTWDGKNTLFDFNFLALGVPASEAFQMARRGREYLPGEFLKVGLAVHCDASAVICPFDGKFQVYLQDYDSTNRPKIVDSLPVAQSAAFDLARRYGLYYIDDRTQSADPAKPNIIRLEDYRREKRKRAPRSSDRTAPTQSAA